MPSPARALVFTAAPGDRYRAGRTLRHLKGLGLLSEELHPSRPTLGDGPVWLVRAGAWPRAATLTLPPPTATGRSLCAVGHALGNEAWAALQSDSGGDLSRLADLPARLPPVVSAYLDRETSACLARRLATNSALPDALRAEIASGRHRVIRFAPLDVHTDDALRVVQVVTSLQRGGAERVALDLHRNLGSRGVRSLLVVLGRPTRAPFAAPPGTLDLSAVSGREARVEAAHRAALEFGADLIHAHLLRGEELARLSSRGIPVAATVHNTRPGWPPGLDALRAGDAALLLACSRA
ncbi:MAG TPA: glycosyltransferase, partial [Gemmataceae bacterium]|nr:glycosyltransferase [Gemmataceae bacterium]